jgi:pimeloyl-ACP methyl ester carboxylesterase
MTFQDYVDSFWSSLELDLGHLTEDARRGARAAYRSYSHARSTTEAFERLLSQPVRASRDAAPAEGRFPLVIYACGFGGKPPAHSVTCEYLASHGYVVACSASEGATALGMTFDADGMEAQARDLEFTLAFLETSAQVEGGKVGVVGVSFGSQAALILAMRRPDVAAVASLDGSLGFRHCLTFFKESPSFSPVRMRVPLLHMNTVEDSYNDLSVFDSLVFCDRLLLTFRGIQHEDFFPVRLIASVTQGPPPQRVRIGYQAVCRRVRSFLDSHLKGDLAAASALLRPPEAGGLPADLFSIRHNPIVDPPPTEEEFASRLLTSGGAYQSAPVFHAALKRFHGQAFVRESILIVIGGRLMSQKRANEAIKVYEMAVAAYPLSSGAFEHLAHACKAAGDIERALANHRKSLELDPRNASAAEAIEELRKGTK